MDTAYLSAISALAGSAIGGMTSLVASWLTQYVQFNAQQRARDLGKREELYRNFIDEASRWYIDAYTHDAPELSNLVNLYALVNQMRIVSSPGVVESADRVALVIIDTYLAPNKGFPDIKELADAGAVNPLREFSNACREELRQLLGAGSR
jgi:hypothetical protein